MTTGHNESRAQEPVGEERWGLATKLLLPAVKAARQCMSLTEEVFRTHTFHTMPREFFLWTALDEVFKTGVFLMKLDGFLGDEEPERQSPAEADPVGRAFEAVLLEEEHLRARRLCELLVQLVFFVQRDEAFLYEHFLLLEELVGAAGFNHDLKTFHGVPSNWVQATVDQTVAAVHKVELVVDASDAWYARTYDRPVRAADSQRLLSSARQRLIRAFPLMTDFERLALGTTYQEAFGGPSSTVHFRGGADPVDHSRESTVVAEGTKLSVIALCAMRRIHELLGRPPVPQLEQITRVLESNQEATRLLTLLNGRPRVGVGDFVLARGYFGQAVEERVLQFGYRSLRVELLAERPLPLLSTDWFRVRDVVRIFSKDKLVEGVRAKLLDPTANVDDLTLREAALGAWENGLRTQVHARTKMG